jgi:hypothetical protein
MDSDRLHSIRRVNPPPATLSPLSLSPHSPLSLHPSLSPPSLSASLPPFLWLSHPLSPSPLPPSSLSLSLFLNLSLSSLSLSLALSHTSACAVRLSNRRARQRPHARPAGGGRRRTERGRPGLGKSPLAHKRAADSGCVKRAANSGCGKRPAHSGCVKKGRRFWLCKEPEGRRF